MKKIFLIVAASLTVFSVSALDNTLSDYYWDTTGYVNGTVQSESAVLAASADFRIKAVCATPAPSRFSTYNGTLITVR